MPYSPNPPVPSPTGIKFPLDSNAESLRESFAEDVETVCSLKLWERVNRRREVCGFPPLKKSQKSAKDLAQGLLEMRDLWVKGEDWNQIQPGDDPLLVRYLNKVNYPMPRTVLARISYEGVAVWKELRVPRLVFDRLSTFQPVLQTEYPYWYPKHNSTTKIGTLITRTSSTVATLSMVNNHGLSVNQLVDIMWRAPQGNFIKREGCRIQVKVKEISGNAVTFEAGTGDKFPGTSTICYVMTDPNKVIKLHIWRPDPHPTCAGVARVCDRMKYTATGRGLDRRVDPKQWIQLNTDAGEPNSGRTPGNSVNQWHNPIFSYDRPAGNGFTNQWPPYSSYRESAIKWTRFSNLSTGVGVQFILRRNDENRGLMFNYLPGGMSLIRATRVTGLSWPGIIYGTPSPELIDTGGSVFGYDNELEYWVEVQNTTLTESISPSQTVIPVASANNLPFTGGYKMKIGNEIILVTDTTHPESGQHTLTVTRGYENTDATSHSSGAVVQFFDVTDFPSMFGRYENWNNPNASNLPYPRSFLKDYVTQGLNDFSGGRGPNYTVTEVNNYEIPTSTYTSTGSWHCPSDVRKVTVLAWAGGGGGGSGGGGGGGAFVRSIVDVTPGTSYPIVVGNGGTGSSEGNGTAGEDSLFGTEPKVRAKGGAGGSDIESDTTALGGKKADCIGDSKYAGGNGSAKGGGGSSAGQDRAGHNAFGVNGAESPALGGDGGTFSVGESPGGGGAATFNGGAGKVVVLSHKDNASLGGIFQGYFAVPDWLPYLYQGNYQHNITKFNLDFTQSADGHTNSSLTVGTYWVPSDLDASTYREWVLRSSNGESSVLRDAGAIHNINYQAGTGYGQLTVVGDSSQHVFATPWWSFEIGNMLDQLEEGEQLIYPDTYTVTNESILIGRDYLRDHAADIAQDWAIQEAITSGIGPGTLLQGSMTLGWTNILSEFDIASAQAVISESIAHDFRQRNASVGLTGSGIAEIDFTQPEFGAHGAEIYIWRRRSGKKTVRKYGPDLFTHSVKLYNTWLSMMWFGGLSINGPSVLKEDAVVTLEDIFDTAVDEVEVLASENSIVKWNNSIIAAGVPELSQIGQGVPDNYVTNIEGLQIGGIFGVDIEFKDMYMPFIKYNFNDSNTGHEANDGPVNVVPT